MAVNEPYSVAVYFELETCIIQIFSLNDFGLSLTTHSLTEVTILMTRSAVHCNGMVGILLSAVLAVLHKNLLWSMGLATRHVEMHNQ